MRQTIISSSKDLALARLSPDTRFSLLPRMGGPPYLQAVGAWLRWRRRLVRLEEDLLAPPEELDNSDEDVVQHQDHARRRPPAPPARPARCARSAVSASATASPVRARVRPGPAPPPPPPRPRPPGPAYVPATRDSTSTASEDRTPTRSRPTRPCQAVTLPRLLQRVGYGDPLSSVASSAFAALRLSHRRSSYLAEHLPESRALPHLILSPSLGLQQPSQSPKAESSAVEG